MDSYEKNKPLESTLRTGVKTTLNTKRKNYALYLETKATPISVHRAKL